MFYIDFKSPKCYDVIIFTVFHLLKKKNCIDEDTVRLKDYDYKKYQIYNFTLKDHPKKSNKQIQKIGTSLHSQ